MKILGLNYIKKNWKGQLPLWVSFWINYFGLCVFLQVLRLLFTGRKSYLSPIQSARFALLIIAIMAMLYPWQIVGLWRSCTNYSRKHQKSARILIVRIIIVVGILITVSINTVKWPIYKIYFKRSFFKDPTAQYTLTLRQNGDLLHLKGLMGYGLSRDVKKLISENPDIEGIILDTPGGRAYEGRQLAKLIHDHGLDTYSLECCASAGTIPFVAGKKRYLRSGSSLIFHRAKMENEHIFLYFDQQEVQRKDYEIYPNEEIEKSFFEKVLSEIETHEYWTPTTQELLDAKVINKTVEIRDVLEPDELDKELLQLLNSIVKLEAQYDTTGDKFNLESTEEAIRKGLTHDEQVEILDQLKTRVEKLKIESKRKKMVN